MYLGGAWERRLSARVFHRTGYMYWIWAYQGNLGIRAAYGMKYTPIRCIFGVIFFFRGSLFLNRPALMEFYRRKYDQKSGDNYVLEAPRTGKIAWSSCLQSPARLGCSILLRFHSNPSDSRAYWYKSVTNSWDSRKVVRGGSSYIGPTGKLRTFWAFSECFYHLLRIWSNLRNSELDRSSVQDILKLIPSFYGGSLAWREQLHLHNQPCVSWVSASNLDQVMRDVS